QLAEDQRERRDRRDREQVVGLLLPLGRDRAGGVCRGQGDDDQRLDQEYPAKDAPAQAHCLGRREPAHPFGRPEGQPQDAAEQAEVERQEQERLLAAHPATQLADPDRGDARGAARVERRVGRGDDRGRHLTRLAGLAHATASRALPDVTCRNSSSRSLAARAKLATRLTPPIARASRSADSASSPRNPSSIWPSSRIAADATRASASKKSRPASIASPSPRTRTRSTAP